MESFPILSSEQEKMASYHTFFQSRLLFFSFCWNRELLHRPIQEDSMSSSLLHVLQLLKSLLQTPDGAMWRPYLVSYYQWMAFTRDAMEGKGEHTLVYRMIWIWYQVFPTLAIYFVHQLATVYGSWRDLPHLCDHIYQSRGKNRKDGLISYCVDHMIRQLERDSACLHAGDYDSISYLAKWLPREYKKMDWLHSHCVLHWAKEYHSAILLSASSFSSYSKAFLKCKRMYRKKVALLNHFLDTTEIKQCSRQESLLIPSHVSKYTRMKQPGLLFSDMEVDIEKNIVGVREDQRICREQFKRDSEIRFFCSPLPKKKRGISLPVSYYIKQAFSLLSSCSNKEDSAYAIRLLNQQWSIFSKQVLPKHVSREPVLPLLDVSFTMQQNVDDSFYTAIGIALLACQKSSLGKRILAVDQFPTWIDLSASCSLMDSVSIICSHLFGAQKTLADFQKALDLLSSFAMEEEGAPLCFLIVSNFSFSFSEGSFYERCAGGCIRFVFWNVSQKGDRLPCSPLEKVRLISGSSACLLKEIFVGGGEEKSAYEHLVRTLSSKRYGSLKKYMESLFII